MRKHVNRAALVLVCFWCENVFGQEPQIFAAKPTSIFDLLGEPTTHVAKGVSMKPGVFCDCIIIGISCDGVVINKGTIDIRIVNESSNRTSCPPGYSLCCKANKPKVPCGRRINEGIPHAAMGFAYYGEYPWHVAILELNTDDYIGAGVIINENYVITAAHKVATLGYNYKMVFGGYNLSNYSEDWFVAYPMWMKKHENYTAENLHNDIAIIRVHKKIPFALDANINSVCLPTHVPAPGTRCWTSGWGKNDFYVGKYQNILKKVDLRIVDSDMCENQFRSKLGPEFKLDQTSFICAGGEPGKDACTGDGGGALVCEKSPGQFEVVGLTAWGVKCALKNVPAAYVNVYNYVPWIKLKMLEFELDERILTVL